jgi:hypothetical protein
MARPSTTNLSSSVAPEFMISPSVSDWFAGWLREAIDKYKAEAREQGNSRALAWEGRTLDRALSQYAPIAEALNRDEPSES